MPKSFCGQVGEIENVKLGGASAQFHSTGPFHLGHHNAHHRQPAVQPHRARSRRSRRLYQPDLFLRWKLCGVQATLHGHQYRWRSQLAAPSISIIDWRRTKPFAWLGRAFECCCAAQAIEHGHVPLPMYVIAALLLGGAFLPPAPRVGAFTVCILAIVALFGKEVR